MSPIARANTGAAFLQSLPSTPGGNWVQNVANASTSGADWMDPNSGSSGQDSTTLAANAFATAAQIKLTNMNSFAVNKGIAHANAVLTGKVNVLA